MRTKFLAVTAAASLLLIAAACADDGDDSAAVENVADAKSDSSDGGDSDGGVAAENGEEEAASGDAVDARGGEAIGITEGAFASELDSGTSVPVTAEITRLERSGDLVELTFTLTNDHASLAFDPLSNFADNPGAGWDVSGVKLVDSEGGQAATSHLDDLTADLEELGPRAVTISGHTDNQGDTTYNQDLSERRAESVHTALSDSLGGDFDFDVSGYGETEPVAENDTDEGQARNRRVEIQFPTD